MTALTACGGGGNSGVGGSAPTVPRPAVPLAVSSSTPVAVPVHLSYTLPKTSNTTTTQSMMRDKQYNSTSTTQLTVTVTPLGGSGTNYTAACTSGSCPVGFTATPGPTTLSFALTDGTNTLSRFSSVIVIAPSQINTLNFSANPVVASAAVQLSSPTVAGATPSDVTVTIVARDADNNIIAGNASYVDNSGQPVTFYTSGISANPGIASLILGPDGNLWFTETGTGNLGRITLAGAVTEFPIGGVGFGLVLGPDKALWAVNGASINRFVI